MGGLGAHAAHACAAVHGCLYGEGDELFHLLCCHSSRFGHDDHGGGIEVGEDVHFGLARRIQSADNEQHRRHEHEYSVLKREPDYLVQHNSKSVCYLDGYH